MIIGISGKKGSGKDTIARMIQYKAYLRAFELNVKDGSQPDALLYFLSRVDVYSSWSIKRFADPLKKAVAAMLNIPIEFLEDREYKEEPLNFIPPVYYVCVDEKKMRAPRGGKLGPLFGSPDELHEAFGNLHIMPHTSPLVISQETTPRDIMILMGTEFARNMIHPDLWAILLMKDYNHSHKWLVPDVRYPNEANIIKAMPDSLLIRVERNDTEKVNHPSETALDDYSDFDLVIANNYSLVSLWNYIDVMLDEKFFP